MKYRRRIQRQPLADLEQPEADPQGSWTGVPAEPGEKPVQDADDL